MRTSRLSGKLRITVLIIMGIMTAMLLYFNYSPSPGLRKTILKAEQLPPPGSRLLIIAPHCDDETLGPGILLNRAIKAGLKVKVVIVTNGDGFTLAVDEDFFTMHPSSQEYREFGYQRQQESQSALATLGLGSKDLYLLGYPDAGVAHLWTEFWDNDKRYYSRYTQTDISPYNDSFNKRAPYTGVSLLADLQKIIRDYRPTHIYYPHPNDRHPDHWGVNAFVKYLLEANRWQDVEERLYLVHRGNWPVPRMPRPDMKLSPPAKLTGLGTEWRDFRFRNGEAALKKSAIFKYHTQIRAMKQFLLAFVRSTELFGIYRDFAVPRRGQLLRDDDPGTIAIADPVEDMVTRDVDRSADIKAIHSYIVNDKWVVELAAAKPVTHNTIYRIHARLFFNDGPGKRFDINYYQGDTVFKRYARDSLTGIPGIKTSKVNGRWRTEIPIKVLGDMRAVFFNADSGVGHFNIDKTAWRMLRF